MSPIEPSKVHCAAILAGGKSSRMGREKALIGFEGQPLIARVTAVLKPIFPQICVVTSKEEVANAASCEAITDHFEARGPLGGIHAALIHFKAPTFVVACDMPFLCRDLIEYLAQNFVGDARVPLSANGIEPLHSVYAPQCASAFESFLDSNSKIPSLRRVLGEIDAQLVPLETVRTFDPTLRCFANWNTPDDIETSQ